VINLLKYFDQSELLLDRRSGLLTRKNISLDNPFNYIDGYVFHNYCFSVSFSFLEASFSWMCQLVYYEGSVSIGSCSKPDFCVEFSQSTSWMTSIVSQQVRGVSRW